VFLIVYVGAIAVLLLFVVMMLNLRLSLLRETGSQFIFVAIFLAINFIAQMFFLLNSEITISLNSF
jgi:NADH-ubiquinone oxidoreductase chain 6